MKRIAQFFSQTIILALIILLGGLLRFYQLGHNPISLYWDEASIGLEAYSVATTGNDTNGLHWLQSIFPAYGDFKAPVLIWLTIPLVYIFGLSEAIVRLPSALIGTATIILVYFFTKALISLEKKHPAVCRSLPLLTAALVAIIPWATHFSRISFESNISVFFLVLTLWLFIKGLKKSGIYFIVSSIAAVIGVYAYYSLRVIIPLTFLILGASQFKKIWTKKYYALIAIIIFITLNIPVFTSRFYAESQKYRASDNTLLTSPKIVQESSSYLEDYRSSFWSKAVYHRTWFYLRDFSKNYSTHFTNDFLFISGDAQLRQHSGYGGEIFPVLTIFFYIGLFFMVKNYQSRLSLFTLTLLLISPIPSSFKYEVPNASRAIYMYIPLCLIIGTGMIHAIEAVKQKNIKIAIILLIAGSILINATLYYLDYFIDYPKRSAEVWLYPYKQASEFLEKNYLNYSKIEITGYYWMPQLFVFFEFPYLAPYIQDLNFAFRTNHISTFGFPMWDEYLYHKIDNSLPQATLLTPQTPIPEKFKLTQKFYFPDGSESLILAVEEANPELAELNRD